MIRPGTYYYDAPEGTALQTVVPCSDSKREVVAYYMDLAVVEVRHTEIALHTAGNHSLYMVVAYFLLTKILSDCLVLFQLGHKRQVLECRNSDSRPLLLEVAFRTHYTS